MKAVTSHGTEGLDGLRLVDMDDPGTPGPSEVRVRIHASSLNFHDLAVVMGHMGAPDGRIPMADGAGVVEAIGANVEELAVGDHVVSTFFPNWLDGGPLPEGFATVPGDGVDGFAREVVLMPATAFTRAPAGWSHAEAATLTTAGLTAWRALIVNGGLRPGDSVLVQGSGGVSVFALQLAKALGATVIATSSSDEKLERLRALGADHAINYRTHEKWGAVARELTGGRGVDHVVEVGGSGTLEQSIEATRVGGHIALIGVLTNRGTPSSAAGAIIRQQRLQGLVVGSRRHQQDMVRGLDIIGVRPVVDRSFPLAGIADAFRLQQRGGHFGKIALEL